MDKVYAILKRSYEFDDIDYGSFVPCFLSHKGQKTLKLLKTPMIIWKYTWIIGVINLN